VFRCALFSRLCLFTSLALAHVCVTHVHFDFAAVPQLSSLAFFRTAHSLPSTHRYFDIDVDLPLFPLVLSHCSLTPLRSPHFSCIFLCVRATHRYFDIDVDLPLFPAYGGPEQGATDFSKPYHAHCKDVLQSMHRADFQVFFSSFFSVSFISFA
jgi:hypothetical protein